MHKFSSNTSRFLSVEDRVLSSQCHFEDHVAIEKHVHLFPHELQSDFFETSCYILISTYKYEPHCVKVAYKWLLVVYKAETKY